ncbi:DUF2752 domain-containing protein [Actinomadura luteofluorescens]|uniref:DUF2752 domain-containing protein n=1 Tax=Actinomadura luteofluorescens TaxID=46163 RepID=UPI0036431572
MAVAAIGASWIHRVNDPGVLCPLRALTGIPCPLCGGTTVFIEFGSGRPGQAVLANPVALAAPSPSPPHRWDWVDGGGHSSRRPVPGCSAPPSSGRSCGSSSGSVFCGFEPRSVLGQTCGAHRVRRASHNHRVNQ